MENMVKLFYDWEIQLLVLLSFSTQTFLLFTGGLRRCNINMLLRLFIWLAYLGADMLAVYALGYLARHEDAHPMSFFWAPFLLIHLGGQDTITAFAMEDNKLWLRHLLNLMVQTILAIYVFWKSMGRHDMQLLLSGVFVFVSGIIKYGERIRALRCGSFESLEDLSEDQYGHSFEEAVNEVIDEVTDGYSNTVLLGLSSMQDVHEFFVAHAEYFFGSDYFRMRHVQGFNIALKLMEIELGVMYNDIYTKAFVLRTKSGIILRCISQMCMIVAFIVFLEGNLGRYGSIDVAITYVLFIGGLFLEVCAVTSLMASPWTWAWLKVQKCDMLARFSWSLFSSFLIGWPEEKALWSNAMGQYNFSGCWLQGVGQPRSCNQRLLATIKGAVKFFGVGTNKIFWMSKMLETEYIEADKKTMECLFEGVNRFAAKHLQDPGHWLDIGPILKHALYLHGNDFGKAIVLMHLTTELHLKKHHCSDMEANIAETNDLVGVCRKLSRYMMHLLVNHPSLLPLNKSAPYTLKHFYNQFMNHLLSIMTNFTQLDLRPSKETLEEIKEAWIWLIIYAAGKSRPEMHAAQLAMGGELLTLVWLQLGHCGFGPMDARIQLNLFYDGERRVGGPHRDSRFTQCLVSLHQITTSSS